MGTMGEKPFDLNSVDCIMALARTVDSSSASGMTPLLGGVQIITFAKLLMGHASGQEPNFDIGRRRADEIMRERMADLTAANLILQTECDYLRALVKILDRRRSAAPFTHADRRARR